MVCHCLKRSGKQRHRAAETLFDIATCQGRTPHHCYSCLGCMACCVPVSLIELVFDIPCTCIEDRCCQGHPYVSNCLQVCYEREEELHAPNLVSNQTADPQIER
jgi:hypothetical protein